MQKIGKMLVLSCCLLSTGAWAQNLDIVNLKPEIVAASNCAGVVSGGAFSNYSLDILNRERTIDVMHASVLYQMIVLLENADSSHIQRYGDEYDAFYSAAVQDVVNATERGEYDWDRQEEADVCSARMLKVLAAPLPEAIEQEMIDEIRRKIDSRFSAMLRLLEAME
ncbi:hypothetical protein [Vreelandella sp. EE22]